MFYYKDQPILGQRGPSGPDGNPLGTVISFMGLTAPDGYLACDGAVYNIADYTELAFFFKAQFGAENYCDHGGRPDRCPPGLHPSDSCLGCFSSPMTSRKLGVHCADSSSAQTGKLIFEAAYDSHGCKNSFGNLTRMEHFRAICLLNPYIFGLASCQMLPSARTFWLRNRAP